MQIDTLRYILTYIIDSRTDNYKNHKNHKNHKKSYKHTIFKFKFKFK